MIRAERGNEEGGRGRGENGGQKGKEKNLFKLGNADNLVQSCQAQW